MKHRPPSESEPYAAGHEAGPAHTYTITRSGPNLTSSSLTSAEEILLPVQLFFLSVRPSSTTQKTWLH